MSINTIYVLCVFLLGFANYMQNIGIDFIDPTYQSMDRMVVNDIQYAFQLDALETTHAISGEVKNPNFDLFFGAIEEDLRNKRLAPWQQNKVLVLQQKIEALKQDMLLTKKDIKEKFKTINKKHKVAPRPDGREVWPPRERHWRAVPGPTG